MRVFSSQAIVQLWLLLKQQANKQWVKTSDGVLKTGLGSRDTFLKVSSRSHLGLELQVSISWSRKVMVSKYEKSRDSKSWLGVGVKF